MHIEQYNSTFIRLQDISNREFAILEDFLAYKDLGAQYEYNKAKKNVRMYLSQGDRWQHHVDQLKASINQSALFNDKEGYFTYAGLLNEILSLKLHSNYTNNIVYPDFKLMGFDYRYEALDLYPYQKEAAEALLKSTHASIELPTGAGKTEVIKHIIKNTGLQTLVVVPYAAIADQFVKDFSDAFGKKFVGMMGDGKKKFDKQITIGIAATLHRMKDDSAAYEKLSKCGMLIYDECHLVGAPTVSSISLGVGKNIPYKYSVSATPFRSDGTGLKLKGIIGDVVYRKEFKELVAGGYLSPLRFKIVNVHSQSNYEGHDPLKTKQEHYLYNSDLLQKAAHLINFKRRQDESILVLIDEKEQIDYLKNYLQCEYTLANADTDCTQIIKDFNDRKIKLVIGTSAIATGANFKPVKTLVLLTSGKSEIKLKQALGRATRLYPGKTHCDVIDFHVQGISQLERHLNERIRIYNFLSDQIDFI